MKWFGNKKYGLIAESQNGRFYELRYIGPKGKDKPFTPDMADEPDWWPFLALVVERSTVWAKSLLEVIYWKPIMKLPVNKEFEKYIHVLQWDDGGNIK